MLSEIERKIIQLIFKSDTIIVQKEYSIFSDDYYTYIITAKVKKEDI